MAIPLNIDYEKLYPTKHDGYVQVIEDLGIPEGGGNRNVRIRFLDTGNEQVAQLANVKNANVRDRGKRDIIGKIFHTNRSGDLEVIEKLGVMGGTNTMYRVRFVKTGYETITEHVAILDGRVRDPYAPVVYGVGYTAGVVNPSRHPEYSIWCDMLRRAYGNAAKYAITYADVTVCERWHNFENFLNDIKYLPGYDKYYASFRTTSYAIDKDLCQICINDNMHKVYSPETCCLISINDNSALVRANLNNYIAYPYPSCIYVMNDIFYVRPIINNQVQDFGEFGTFEAAANALNYHCSFYGLTSYIIPNVPYMPPQEFLKYRISIPKPLTKEVEKSTD